MLPAASCGDLVGPPITGTFILEEVNGEPLPVSWQPYEAHSITLLHDTLVLSSERRFRRVRAIRQTEVATGITADVTEEWEGSVLERGGSWILLSDICDSESLAICVLPPTVRTVGSSLLVRTESCPQGRFLFTPAG